MDKAAYRKGIIESLDRLFQDRLHQRGRIIASEDCPTDVREKICSLKAEIEAKLMEYDHLDLKDRGIQKHLEALINQLIQESFPELAGYSIELRAVGQAPLEKGLVYNTRPNGYDDCFGF